MWSKKVITFILAALMMFSIAVPAFADAGKNGYKLTYNEKQYTVGMDAATAMSELGTVKSSRDVNNCANGYINKAYTYGDTNDLEISVEQDKDGKEIVAAITLMTDKVKTEEGLKVGDSDSTVKSIYKDAVKGLGNYKVNKDGTQLFIKMQNGKVSFIAYNLQ
jgi:hypothetical protein